MQPPIKEWIRKYGKSYQDDSGWYNDCDMIDSCMFDLTLDEQYRSLVTRLVLEYIRS